MPEVVYFPPWPPEPPTALPAPAVACPPAAHRLGRGAGTASRRDGPGGRPTPEDDFTSGTGAGAVPDAATTSGAAAAAETAARDARPGPDHGSAATVSGPATRAVVVTAAAGAVTDINTSGSDALAAQLLRVAVISSARASDGVSTRIGAAAADQR